MFHFFILALYIEHEDRLLFALALLRHLDTYHERGHGPHTPTLHNATAVKKYMLI